MVNSWSVTAAGGGRFPAIDPVYFNDKSRVAVATALAIKIYQLGTKQMITKISVDLTDAAQLILVNSEKEFLVVRRSGSVDQISLLDGESKRLELDGSVKIKKILKETTQGSSFVALALSPKGMYEIGELTHSNSWSFNSFFESKLAHADSGIVAVSNNTHYASFLHPKSGKCELFNVKTANAETLSGANRSVPVSLAVSDNGLLAIGHASGVIDLVYPNKGGMRALKWHLEPVKSLKFSQHDEYLLSGGSERVLVFWQLATNRQQFLPRLDGTITSISSNAANTLYGLILNDSQLVIISAVDLVSRLQVSGTKTVFTKLPPDHQVARRRRRKRPDLDMWANTDYTTPLSIHPGTRNAYLLSGSAQAQAFSLMRDDEDSVLSLAHTLDTGKVRRELEIQDPSVELLKFTSNGEYMITVDVVQTPPGLLSSNDREINLKFWAMNDGKWTVVTRVASPHGNYVGSSSTSTTGQPGAAADNAGDIEIKDMIATNDTVITAGSDGSLRMWRLNAAEKSWSLRQIMPAFAAYTRYVSVAMSSDKSVLALAHDAMIYLIDTKHLKIVKQLPNITGSAVRALHFVRSNIIALTRTRLVVYNLVSMSERWSIALKSPSHSERLIAADPVFGKVALVVNYWTPQYRVNSRILLFNPEVSPIPEESLVHPFAVGSIALIPGTSSYCFIDQRGVLCTLAGSTSTATQETKPIGPQNTLVSLHQTKQTEVEAAVEVDEGATTKNLDVNTISKLFESNTSLENLFDRVLTSVS